MGKSQAASSHPLAAALSNIFFTVLNERLDARKKNPRTASSKTPGSRESIFEMREARTSIPDGAPHKEKKTANKNKNKKQTTKRLKSTATVLFIHTGFEPASYK